MTDSQKFVAMLICTVILTLRLLSLGSTFVAAKIRNDASIAEDTKRIADALDKKPRQAEGVPICGHVGFRIGTPAR